MATFGFLCRSNAQGREADRPAGAGADQVPARSQSQDRQGDRPRSAADAARPRRRGDRIAVRICCAADTMQLLDQTTMNAGTTEARDGWRKNASRAVIF